HADLGGEELFVVGALVGVALAAAVILDDEVHFLDAFAPDDVVVLPELRHGDVLLIHTGLLVNVGADAAVAMILAFVWYVADAPGGGLAAGGLFDDFEAHVHGAVAIVHRRGPVLRALGVEAVAFDVVVRWIRFGVIGVGLGVGEGDVEEHELLGAAE